MSASSSLLNEGERPLDDFLLRDLGGGDRDLDTERDDPVLAADGERLMGLLRLSAAASSGEADLVLLLLLLALERPSSERSREGIAPKGSTASSNGAGKRSRSE